MNRGIVEKEFQEKVLAINRIAKKIKGGSRRRFTALVAIGDGKGRVGVGYGRAGDVRTAIEKAKRKARREVRSVPLAGTTVPRRVEVKEGAARIMIKPAPPGSGLIAGGAVRDLLELAGYKDAVGKILGTRSKMTNVRAVLKAFKRWSDEVE